MALDERKDRRDDWSSFWNEPFTSWLRQRGPDHPFGFFRRHPAGASERDVNWTPDIETFQRGDQFVVRVDLPGITRDDITLQVTDDALTIEGERRSEFTEHHNGLYRTERTYGNFSRVIPLPGGAMGDTARASFENGVLEVAMQAPPREVSRGSRVEVEIVESSQGRESKKPIFPE
jgi:HSP20 family molecular chaperone IbpA